jgi:hypothetical protein
MKPITQKILPPFLLEKRRAIIEKKQIISWEIKTIINNLIPEPLLEKRRAIVEKKELIAWKMQGKPVPPPHRIKELAIEQYQKKRNISILIETGTFMGDMIKAQLKNFKTIYSIELGEALWKKAVKRFEKDKHVKIFHGDSGKVFVDLIPKINEKAIFWLDGHYSGGITAKGEKECPIYEELDVIFNSKLQHILLIDDARYFNGENDFPTIQKLSEYILSRNSKSNIEIKDDIIRIELQ